MCSSVLFSSLGSNSVHLILFGPVQSYLVHIGSMRSTLVLFGLFCPLRSYSVHSFLFGPFGLIQSTLILFGPFGSIQSTLVQFGLCYSIPSNSVHFCPFFPIQSITQTHIFYLFIIINLFYDIVTYSHLINKYSLLY